MTSVSNDERRDALERKKKQEEYHRILDQQLAEKQQRKQQELEMRRQLLDTDDVDENAKSLDSSKCTRFPTNCLS